MNFRFMTLIAVIALFSAACTTPVGWWSGLTAISSTTGDTIVEPAPLSQGGPEVGTVPNCADDSGAPCPYDEPSAGLTVDPDYVANRSADDLGHPPDGTAPPCAYDYFPDEPGIQPCPYDPS